MAAVDNGPFRLFRVPQQVAVLAYQFGDGFTNMVVPTSALVMGTLALGKIPYTRWVRFVMPLLVKLFLMAILVLILPVRFGDAWGFNVTISTKTSCVAAPSRSRPPRRRQTGIAPVGSISFRGGGETPYSRS